MKIHTSKLRCAILLLTIFECNCAVAQDTRDAELASADRQLNIIFKRISGEMDSATRARLIAAQRAWLTFRDLDCKWAFQAEPRDCLLDRTVERTKQLEDSVFYDLKGNYRVVEERKNK